MAQEKSFENKIKRFLTSRGIWHVKYFANRMTRAGVPDLLACINGRFVAIEVKAENGRPSDLQLWNIRQIKKSGGIALVLYPDDFEDFQRLVDNLLKENDSASITQQN